MHQYVSAKTYKVPHDRQITDKIMPQLAILKGPKTKLGQSQMYSSTQHLFAEHVLVYGSRQNEWGNVHKCLGECQAPTKLPIHAVTEITVGIKLCSQVCCTTREPAELQPSLKIQLKTPVDSLPWPLLPSPGSVRSDSASIPNAQSYIHNSPPTNSGVTSNYSP